VRKFPTFPFLPILFCSLVSILFSTESKSPDPLRFAKDFEKFADLDQEQSSTPEKITLFTGSSSIRLWKSLEEDFAELSPLNRGFGGAHISDVLFYYDLLFSLYRPHQIVFYCGENDLWSGKPVDQVFQDFSSLWKRIGKDLPLTQLIYLSCKPSPKRFSKWNLYQSLNLKIKNVCLREEKLTFIDLSPTLLLPNMTFHTERWKDDQLHVNQLGYNFWKKWIRSAMGIYPE